MTPLQAWNMIVDKLKGTQLEFPTVPKIKKTPIWFSATSDGKAVFIDNAIENKPSCQLSMPRKLTYKTFEKVYPLYLRRENGERISNEVASVTVNQVYYFSLIKHLCQ
ncbi:hypothetical protein [Syntrophomonas wolfei]|jgi:hypothetical protein|uniref:hypothetical protein n=1 Tax=Syntrophomonas wolfei TaxID=863 RepID=UPI0007739EF5|nr:hypothetical protein [Syntrophomonas wolfei]